MESTYDLNEKFLDYDNFIEEFFGSEPRSKNSVLVPLIAIISQSYLKN